MRKKVAAIAQNLALGVWPNSVEMLNEQAGWFRRTTHQLLGNAGALHHASQQRSAGDWTVLPQPQRSVVRLKSRLCGACHRSSKRTHFILVDAPFPNVRKLHRHKWLPYGIARTGTIPLAWSLNNPRQRSLPHVICRLPHPVHARYRNLSA